MILKFSIFLATVISETIRFPVLGDWGGRDGEPYYTHAKVLEFF